MTENRSSSPAPEAITFTVKASNDTKYSVSFPLTATIAEVKAKLVELSEVPIERQRLIYSGRVMKNEETLETYKVKSGNTIHMVKGAASNVSASTGNVGGASGGAAASASGVPRNLASGSGNNPLAGLTGARYAGHVQLPSADLFGPDGGVHGPPPDPEGIAQALSNPMFQAQMNEMLRNPQLLDHIIASNPMLQSMGPQARELMQSDLFRQMMTDPSLIRQMSRMGAGAGLGGQAAFPAPGTIDTPGAEGQQQIPPPQQQGQQQQANPFASLFGGMYPPGMYPPPFVPPTQGSQPGSPPPEQPAMGANPFLNPAAFQQMMQLMGGGGVNPTGSTPSSGASSPPANPFAGLFGGMPPYAAASPAPPDTRPPEERYADQLRQLNDMGFFDFDRNVEALRRSGGSVQGAINQLLGG
ncbi:hypothetical protein BDD12DRAFT_737225 [Trichophaea hybrida]|nr:hypothetical protein BDD12DRAFT_737225 [Trichophaea hybrida]